MISKIQFLNSYRRISNSMNKTLALERDEQKNLKIRLANQDFLGKSREELPLSTGEQNFLSLTFEFLKAKNSDKPIVVVDDPISSFDSIYKRVKFALLWIGFGPELWSYVLLLF